MSVWHTTIFAAAAINGLPRAQLPYLTWITIAAWAILGLCVITVLVIGLLGRGGGSSDDSGPGPGGGGPDLPRPPEDDPRSGEPQWWPEFERQFADYLKRKPARSVRSSSESSPTQGSLTRRSGSVQAGRGSWRSAL
jgi:hypothetical protein